MKKCILQLLICFPVFVFAQKPLDKSVVEGLPNYVQVTMVGYVKGFKAVNEVVISGDGSKVYHILSESGTGDHVFNSDAELLNYLDAMGFDFITYVPAVAPVVAGVMSNKLLFKRKH